MSSIPKTVRLSVEDMANILEQSELPGFDRKELEEKYGIGERAMSNLLKRQEEVFKTCSIYEKSFAKNSILEKHLSVVHKGEKLFNCNACEKSFKYKRILKDHKTSVHEEKKVFECSICLNTFT